MKKKFSEEEIAAAHQQAEEDIAWATDTVQRLAAGLRQYNTLVTDETRVQKIATLCSMLTDIYDEGHTNLLAGMAIVLISESELLLSVADDPEFRAMSEATEAYLRAAGKIK